MPKATFASRCRNLLLIRQPQDVVLDAQRHPTVIRGKYVEFVNGRYTTDDPDTIEWLMTHKSRPAEFDVVPDKAIRDRETDIKLIEGALGVGRDSIRSDGIAQVPKVEEPKVDVKAEILAEVDAKITMALSQILDILKTSTASSSLAIPTEPKPKKVFKCPHCGEQFKTGFDVGTHKREAHPELYVKKMDGENIT